MNLAMLSRFAPLLSFADKPSSELSDDDLRSVAAALAGDGADDMIPFLQLLRAKEPAQRVLGLLESPTARTFFRQFQEQALAGREERDNTAFIKCQVCGVNQEITLTTR